MILRFLFFVLVWLVTASDFTASLSGETCSPQEQSRSSDYCRDTLSVSHPTSSSNAVPSDDSSLQEEEMITKPLDSDCLVSTSSDSVTSCSRPVQGDRASARDSRLGSVGDVIDTLSSSNDPDVKVADESELPIALWWNPFTHQSHVTKQCTLGKCVFTHNREEITKRQTRAVFFYGSDVEWDDLPLPRRPDIYWALLHDESPKNEWAFNHDNTISLFNFTSTFSRYSDVPLTTRFLKDLNWLQNPPVSLMSKKDGNRSAVAYVQSSCHSPSDRERYVKELMKHIRVDSLGSCFHNKDLPDGLAGTQNLDQPEFWELMAKYKFTLAFENADCPDYITEKLWRTLHVGSVPIYLGTETARDWIPSNRSVIFVRDFSSPKELAAYITYLDNNEEEYLKYLQFKLPGGITNRKLIEEVHHRVYSFNLPEVDFIRAFECYVCDRIHETTKASQSGENVVARFANNSHYGCPKPFASLENVPSDMEDFQLNHYQRAHEQAYVIGEAVNNMIAAGEADSTRYFAYLKQQQQQQQQQQQ